jgi:hypothetical protein
LALAMLYLGEGTKSGNSVILANTDIKVVRYFVSSLRQLYDIDEQRLSFRLHLVEAARAREPELVAWWCAELNCQPEQFRQTGYDRRNQTGSISDDYRGVCAVVYHNTGLHQLLMGLVNTYLKQRLQAWGK